MTRLKRRGDKGVSLFQPFPRFSIMQNLMSSDYTFQYISAFHKCYLIGC
jgi:hypothetical protein